MLKYFYKILFYFITNYTCCICLNDLKLINFYVFNCGHLFCRTCLVLFINRKCPICKSNLIEFRKITYMRCLFHNNLSKFKYLICFNCGVIFCLLCLKKSSNIALCHCYLCSKYTILREIYFC